MGVTTHPLAERFPRLVKPELSGELNTFYNVVGAALTEYEAAVDKARQVSRDYIPEKRATRQHQIIGAARKKFNDTLAKEIQAKTATAGSIRREIELASQARTADQAIDRLTEQMRAAELRAELRQMDSAARAKVLRESVQKGDRSILTALEGALIPICAPILLDSAKEDYARAVAAPALERLADAENLLSSAKETARRAIFEMDKILKAEKEILPEPQVDLTISPVAGLTDSRKSALISEIGLEGFQEVLAGTRPLPLEFALSDETKAELEAWAGPSAYAEIMSGKRELPPQFAPPAE